MNNTSTGNQFEYATYVEEDKIYIDFKNLARHLLTKWRVIIICSLLTSLIGGLIGYARQKELNSEISSDGSMVENVALNLSDEQKAEAEGYYSQLCAYDEAIENQKRNNNDSYIMNLDESTVVGYYLQYLLETDIENVSSVFLDSVITETDYEDIADILGIEPDRIGANEAVLFRIDAISRNSSDDDKNANLAFTIYIYAPDKTSCKDIVRIVENSINRKIMRFKEQGESIACILADEGYNNANSRSYIAAKKQEKTNALGGLMTNRANFYNNIISKTDTDEKLYIDSLLEGMPGGDLEEAPTVSIFGKSVMKYTLVGFLTGLFALICLLVIMYIFAGKLRTTEELTECCRIPVLQMLSKDIKGKAALDMLSNELVSKTKKEEIKSVYVAVDVSSADTEDISQRLLSSTQGGATFIAGRIKLEPDDMRCLLDSESVLLLPVIDHTNMKDIKNFIDICIRNGKNVIGAAPVWETNDKT